MPIAAAKGFELGDVYALGLLFAGVVLFAAILALSRQDEYAFTAAIVYLVLGAVASLGLQALGVDLLDPLEDHELIERLAEFAVIVALFASGLRIDRALTWRRWSSTVRLIAIVMPLTIGAITLFGTAAMGLSLGAAVILGAILAPTDPVLASSIQVGPPGEPDASEPRFALTSEAGLNDGLAFPFVMLGIFIAGESGSDWIGEWLAADVLYAITVGGLLGAAAGYALAAIAAHLRLREWLRKELDPWLAIAVVLAVYGVTELAGAYGFIAAFVGGLAFRRHEVRAEHHQRVHDGARLMENVTELAMVLLFGSTVTLAGAQRARRRGLATCARAATRDPAGGDDDRFRRVADRHARARVHRLVRDSRRRHLLLPRIRDRHGRPYRRRGDAPVLDGDSLRRRFHRHPRRQLTPAVRRLER